MLVQLKSVVYPPPFQRFLARHPPPSVRVTRTRWGKNADFTKIVVILIYSAGHPVPHKKKVDCIILIIY